MVDSNSFSVSQHIENKTHIIMCKLCNRPIHNSQVIKHLECVIISGNAIIQELKAVSEYLRKKQIINVETVEEHIDRRIDNVQNEIALASSVRDRESRNVDL